MIMRIGKTMLVALVLCAAFSLAAAADAGTTTFTNPSPAFSVSYPDSYAPKPLKKNEVLRVVAPMGLPALIVSVRTSGKPQTLDQSLKIYTGHLATLGTEVKVVKLEKVKLAGMEAIKAKITWKHNGFMALTTLFVSFIKDKKLVMAGAHTIGELGPMEAILKTIEIK